jgi:tungstate transport system permease protein
VSEILSAFTIAFELIVALDHELIEIIRRTLLVSLSAVVIATVIGLPAGAVLAVVRFPGRRAVIVLVNALMGLPPVVVGLLIYLVLSRSGPLGFMGLMFSPTAMIVAQCVLIVPIVTALSHQVLRQLWEEYREQLCSFGATLPQMVLTILWDSRRNLVTGVMAGFGRAVAEVGAVLIVGGNIAGVTRVMTTTIALETSKGDLALALALGMILVVTAIALNGSAFVISGAHSAKEA